MPGFAVRGIDGQFGGRAAGAGPPATQEYYLTYTWVIDQMIGNFDSLLINAKDITLPTFSVGIEVNQGASLEYKFAKNVSYDDVKVTFYDAIGLITILKEWRKSVWTPDDGLKTASSYKKDSILTVHTPQWSEDNKVIWELTGSWPSVIRHGELTYTSSDVKIVEVTITYDYAESDDISATQSFNR